MINGAPGIVIYCGPMFSSKSDELIAEAHRAEYGQQKVLGVVPKSGSRNKEKGLIASRKIKKNSEETKRVKSYPAHFVSDSNLEVLDNLIKQKEPDVLVIDEAHFFENSAEEFQEVILEAFWDKRIKIYLAGLDLTALGTNFKWCEKIMPQANEVHKLSAVCFVRGCNKEATHTQLISPTVDISEENPLQVGDRGTFESRCFDHWCHPKKMN
ncbi:MAG: hypothetical protein ABEI53_00320 [Candidatus Magasanikbacteria bacterium]